MVFPDLSISIKSHLGEEEKNTPSAKWICYGPWKELKP